MTSCPVVQSCSVGGDKSIENDHIVGFDHITFWVGLDCTIFPSFYLKLPRATMLIQKSSPLKQVSNAKQVAIFYHKLFGMKPFAYRGLETDSRSVASHVVKQNKIVFQFESALEPGNSLYGDYLTKHGDAVKDVALTVVRIEKLVEQIKRSGGKIVQEVHHVTDKASGNSVKIARVNPYGDFTHTLIERGPGYETPTTGCFLPNYAPTPLEVSLLLAITLLTPD